MLGIGSPTVPECGFLETGLFRVIRADNTVIYTWCRIEDVSVYVPSLRKPLGAEEKNLA